MLWSVVMPSASASKLGMRRWRMAVSGFGFVAEGQRFAGCRRIFLPLGVARQQFLAALDLLLPLLFFLPQHGDVTGDVVAALGGHLVSHRADFFDGDVSFHINLGRPRRAIPMG